jgi:hypothetical protein
MSDDKLSFLDDQPAESTPASPAPEIVQPVAAEPVKVETPAAPIPELTKTVETAPAPKNDGPQVPLSKYLDAHHEAREYKRKLAEFESKQVAPQAPDPALDPEGYTQFQTQTFENRILDQKISMSEIMATQIHGADLVKEARAAVVATGDELLAQKFLKTAHPIEEVVKWFKQQKLLSDIGENPDEYVKRRWAEMNAAPAVDAGSQQPQITKPTPPVIPPPSLSRAPSTGAKPSDVPVGAGNAFDSVFSK